MPSAVPVVPIRPSVTRSPSPTRRPAGQRRDRERYPRRADDARRRSVTTTAGSVTTGNTTGDTALAVGIRTLAGRTTQVVRSGRPSASSPGRRRGLEPGDGHQR
jgi:hypothetical protein